MKRIVLLLITFIVLPLAIASQEGVLELSSLMLESRGIGLSGPVTVRAIKNDAGDYVEVSVNAFGKEYDLDKELLKKISGTPFNGIQMSYEQGYAETGDRTLYILFQKGFSSGVKERILLIVNENGSIEVGR